MSICRRNFMKAVTISAFSLVASLSVNIDNSYANESKKIALHGYSTTLNLAIQSQDKNKQTISQDVSIIKYNNKDISVKAYENFILNNGKDVLAAKSYDYLQISPSQSKIDDLNIKIGDINISYEKDYALITKNGNKIKVENMAQYNYKTGIVFITNKDGSRKEVVLWKVVNVMMENIYNM